MGPPPLSSARLTGGSTLSARRAIPDTAGLRVRVDARRCKRRLHGRWKVTAKAAERTLKVGGPNKKAANQKESGRTVQLRRRGTVKLGAPGARRAGPRDPKTVFVAGATGRLGSRIVRELAREGFKVLAGARNVDEAEESIAVAAQFGILTSDQARRVKIVDFSLSDKDTITAAIGNAGKVVSAMGCRDFVNPCSVRNVDGEGNIKIINAAAELGVEQFVLVTAIGTGKFGWPASSTNLLWGILTEKRRSEKALEASGMAYTIVRPGGIERPTDSHKETHNLTIGTRDTLFGGSVSRLQVAELIAACCSNPQLSQNKTLEAIARTDAPLLDYTEILANHPAEVDRAEQLKKQEAAAQALKDIAAAEKRIEDLKSTSQDLGERAAALQARVKEFQSAERSVAAGAAGAVRAAAKLESDLEVLRSKAEELARQEAAARAVLAAIQKAGRSGKLLSKQEQDVVAFPILQPEVAKAKAEEEKRAKAEAAQARKVAKQKPQVLSVAKVKETAPKTVPKPSIPRKAPFRALAPAVKTAPKTAEALSDAGIEQIAIQQAEAAREAKRQEEEKKRAARAAKLEQEQQAKAKASEEARKKAEAQARKKEKAAVEAQKAAVAAAAEKAAKREAQLRAEAQEKEKERLAAEAEAKAKKAEEAAKKKEEMKKAKEAKEAERKAAAEAAAKKKEEMPKVKPAKDVERSAVPVAAKTKSAAAPAVGGFRWPWEAREPPVPQEILERREEAQAWIDAWKTGGTVKKEEVTDTKPVEAPKEKQAVAEPKTVVKPAKKAAPVAKAKPAVAQKMKPAAAPSGGGFKWPWESKEPPVPQEILDRRQEAQDWIDAWKTRTAEGSSGDSVEDAREWIRNWRAKNLQK